MRNKKHVFKKDDRIQIINPQFFIRCGYPLNKQSIKDNQLKNGLAGDLVKKMFRNLNLQCEGYTSSGYYQTRGYQRVLDGVALAILDRDGFGGNERTIHTEIKPDFLNKTGRVLSKKIVKTGIRQTEYDCGDFGSWSWNYLGNQESHVILEIFVDSNKIGCDSVWIEEKNVREEKYES